VILATLFAYFFLISVGIVLLVFPDYRARLISVLGSLVEAGHGPVARLVQRLAMQVGALRGNAASTVFKVKDFVSAYPAVTAGALLMLLAPSVLALMLRGPAVFEFGDDAAVADRQIAILLAGEQLVPPVPLPPEVFLTREVEMVRPDIVHASRNWNLLDAEFTQRLLVVFKLMKERYGYDMVLIEGYRSPERQAKLQEQGSHVTQVGANMSYHQYGLAADSAFFRDGKVVISERDPWAMRGYQLYGEVAEQVGLTWGGRWKMQDYGHVELRRKGGLGRPASQAQP